MTDRQIHYVCNLAIYTPSFAERMLLMFCKLQKLEGDTSTVWYKVFADRLYIYRREAKAQKALPVAWDGGAHSPWMN